MQRFDESVDFVGGESSGEPLNANRKHAHLARGDVLRVFSNPSRGARRFNSDVGNLRGVGVYVRQQLAGLASQRDRNARESLLTDSFLPVQDLRKVSPRDPDESREFILRDPQKSQARANDVADRFGLFGHREISKVALVH